ncbi:MAG: protein-glutamate O-methyltransferase CheR [Thermoplasmata archaeon]|nr:MAG: protein-glutamate O-methyltransferase CheR [Thermoplasmata archaeon]
MEEHIYPKDFHDLKKGIKQLIGFNTGQYKNAYLGRRFNARMRSYNVDTYHAYWEILKKDHQEQQRLRDDLTINVTEFFRDTSAYEFIQKDVLPTLSSEKEKIRIWSAGSSDGKEAYSIAMMWVNLLGIKNAQERISIIGSDIDRESLEQAKRGEYIVKPGITQTDITKQLDFIKKPEYYFNIQDNVYSIKPEVKQIVKFENHDLISGEKKTNFDMVLCRNVVIYFNRELQEVLYNDFYNALNLNGFFVMGKTETLIGESRNLFDSYNTRERIFKKIK